MWNPDQYLKFGEERTQPCRDLANRIQLAEVRNFIDLGCGPGNSTSVVAARWPEAEVTYLDSSPQMLEKAKKDHPRGKPILGDIEHWAFDGSGQFDLVFANAALHWVPDHASIFPQLLSRSRGALAVQMPGNFNGPAHELMRSLAQSPSWRHSFAELPPRYTHELEFYYDLLTPRTAHLELWATEYVHVMENAAAIVEWYKATGLKPYLDALRTEADRDRFTAEYLERVASHYRPRPDGHVLFPFRRIFILAYAR